MRVFALAAPTRKALRSRWLRTSLLIAFLTLAATPVVAQNHLDPYRDGDAIEPGLLARADQTFAFTIPRKPLAEALAEFSAITRFRVRYTDQPSPGLAASPVIGSYTAAEALQHLLASTGFTARLTDTNTVTIERITAGADRFQIESTTVTGEKTERTLQDTATSVSIFTGEDLDERPGIATLDDALLDDALGRLPNVLDTGTGNFAPTIRGSDTTGPAEGVIAFIAGTRSRVTTQLDGRPLTYNEFVFGQTDLWDVDRVEVFRGPQTTLQGRNSIAGTIIVKTRDPTFDYEVNARVIAGNFDTQQFSGVISGPIVKDQLVLRLSVDQRYHETWVDVIRQPIGVKNIEEEEATNVRAKLLFRSHTHPDLSAKLTFMHIDTRQPQVEFANRPFDKRRLTTDQPGFFPLFETESNSSVVHLNYFLTPEVELHNTAAYSKIDIDRLTDPGSGNHASGFSIGFDGRYVSGYFSDDLNDSVNEIDAFFVFNAQAAYQFKNFRFFAFVNNIFDRDYKLLIFSDTAQLGDPREFGFGLQVSF